MKPPKFFIKVHGRQRRKAKMKSENVTELFISNYCMKQIKSVFTLNAIFAACSRPNSQRSSFTTPSLRGHLLISGREIQRQRETKSWEPWPALRFPLAIINPMIDVSFSTFPTLHREEQRKCYLTFYYWCKVSMSKTRKPSPSIFFHRFAWVYISVHWPAESIDSHQY